MGWGVWFRFVGVFIWVFGPVNRRNILRSLLFQGFFVLPERGFVEIMFNGTRIKVYL